MNVRGLKLDYSLIKRFLTYDICNLDLDDIKGISSFEEYNWTKFNFDEFISIMKAIHYLNTQGIFDQIDGEQDFVFFYENDITEMDVVTVLEYKKRMIFIDIEIKTGVKTIAKLKNQVNKRIKEKFPQIIPFMEYIVIGIVDESFCISKTNIKGFNKIIKNIDNLRGIFKKLSYSENVRNCLIQANNLASISTSFKAIENKTFKYNDETNALYNYIKKHIQKDADVILCLSKAGTGKSFAALKLFFEFDNTALLLMNIKFYNALNLNKYFFNRCCTWKPQEFLSYDFSNKVAIIDECQRLSEEQIVEISKKAGKIVIFGDLEQSFMENDLSCGRKNIITMLTNEGLKVREKPLKTVKRFSQSASEVINFMIDYSSDKEPPELHGFEINLFYDDERFLKKYKECKGVKKLYTTYNQKDNNFIIYNELFKKAPWDYDDFSIDPSNSYYIGNTLHAISFDVEHCFVYLPDLAILKENGKIYFINNSTGNDKEKIRKLHNELVILFSRAQFSLNIYVSDLKTFLFLNRRYYACRINNNQ